MSSNKKSGFTIVELTLAMTFLSLLMLAIAMMTLQIGAVYTKGMTLREVNQAGQQLSSDVQRTLAQSVGTVTTVGDATGGRLCVDNMVYAWNYGPRLGRSGAFNAISGKTIPDRTTVRFVKFVRTTSTNYCAVSGGVYPELPGTATEVLGAGNGGIALRGFSLVQHPYADDTTQTIYAVTMLIGTKDTGAIGAGGAGACTPDPNLDANRCAVNEFNFTARAGKREE